MKITSAEKTEDSVYITMDDGVTTIYIDVFNNGEIIINKFKDNKLIFESCICYEK